MTIKAHSDHITQIEYIRSIDRIVSTSLDGKVCLLDPVTKLSTYFFGHTKSVLCLCFVTAYKYLVTSGQERDIQLWNPYTQKRITSLIGHSACVRSIVCNPTHNHLISLSIDKQVIVWDPKTYERLCSVFDTEHMYRPEV